MLKEHHFEKATRVKTDCLLFLPEAYEAKSGKRWPLILFLHGAGERGSNLRKVATHGPLKYSRDHPDFPFIVVAPQCPKHQTWSKEVLLALLDEIIGTNAVDPARLYLTGLSMGGYGSWDLGLAHPERFAALVPICGGGDPIDVFLAEGAKRRALKTLGIWAFHGGKDPVVPLQESKRMVEFVKRASVREVHFTVYPKAGHDSWTETYANPELYEWLLRHRRKLSR